MQKYIKLITSPYIFVFNLLSVNMYFVRVVSMVIFIFTLNFFKMNRFLKYFLQGLLLLAPLTLTAFVLVKVFWFLDGLIPKELPLWKLQNQKWG